MTSEYENSIPTTQAAALTDGRRSDFPPQRVVERKIGRATFIVASRFNDSKEKDLVSTLSRLIQHDNDKAV